MAYLNQKEAFEDFRERVFEGIKHHFPVDGRLQTLELEGLELRGDPDPDNIRDQHKAKVDGGTWSTPIYGTLALKDKETGKVIDRKKVRMADLPGVTRRYSYVVGGQEWQVDNQWQLKPGVYVRRQQNGELETQFNVPNKQAFDVVFDPESKQFRMKRGKSSNIPMYPLMKVLGVDDDTLEKQWGKDVLAANKDARAVSTALTRFFKADKKRAPKSVEEAERYFAETMEQSALRPESTELTLGKGFKNINGDTFLRATNKMLMVQQGKTPEDDRDSLVYKDLRSAGDFAYDKLTDWRMVNAVKNKAMRKINSASSVRDVVRFDAFNEPVKQLFSKSGGLSRVADQINPVEMVSSSMKTTLMGPGGIKSERGVVDEAKLVNDSHLGYLDPIHTPESENTGVTLHLPIGAKKRGREPVIPLYNMKTGKVEQVGPRVFMESSVVLPDQVEWKNGKPKPISADVQMSKPGNKVGKGKASDAQYVLRHPSQLFSMTSNLIPFMGNDSGNRASYATHHIDQAISLRDREAPLVQTGTGSKQAGFRTFEEFLGQRTAAHAAPMAGKVVSVARDGIVIQGKDGTKKEVQLYNNFPLNDQKAVLDSTARVKVGDSVKKGQSIADTNFTKDGNLALGTNLNVAYIPYKGYNFEDGVVISESAAKKMASEHMHKPSTVLDKLTITDPKKFMIQHPESFTKDQYNLLGDDGVVRVGTIVKTGDPLMLGTRPYQLKDKTGAGAIRKNSSGSHTDVSMKWESDHPGEVVGVHRNKKGELTVHVRTVEPMQIGDKLSGRHGNKGIVTLIVPDKDMPHTKEGKHIEVALNPSGVPGRMNVGQVLETAAGKIAQKTGQPYIVENFGRVEDQLAKVKAELKQHGISDTEELIDPATGMSLGKALVGPQHLLKLTHQVDKKISARGGMDIAGTSPESYDLNLMPAGGKKTGAQSMGNLGMYVMLAHGAKCFLGSTEVIVRGGKRRNQISSIVRNRKAVEVLSYNQETGSTEWKPIVAWQARLAAPGELVSVEYSAFTRSGRKKRFVTKCTGGHEFYTPDGKVEAADLKQGDQVLVPGSRMSDAQRQVVLGSLLGDGSLSRNDTFSSNFRVSHCAAQREYLELKHRLLRGFAQAQVSKVTGSRGGFSKGPQYRFFTRSTGEFSSLRDMFYPKGAKVVPISMLEEELTDAGLAFWYFDDGSVAVAKRGGYRTVRLATYGFSWDDVQALCDLLQRKWGISGTVRWKDPKRKKYPFISLFNRDADEFLSRVAPYAPECMRYKLAGVGTAGAALKKLEEGSHPVGSLEPVVVSKIRPYSPKRYEDYLVYNIEVGGNHNYFANGVLVGNSNIREMQTWKSEGPDPAPDGKQWASQHFDVWNAIQRGDPLPTPKPTFAFQKFTDMLRASGINVEKKGNRIQLTPLTDAQVLGMSNGELPDPTGLTHTTLDDNGDPKPIKGGLFDPKITGGHSGKKWSHFKLAEPMPNPVFEGAIQKVLGLTQKQFAEVVESDKAIDPKTGALVTLGTKGAMTGGPAISHMLKQIDVKKDLAKAEQELTAMKLPANFMSGGGTSKLDKALKRVKYLRTLDEAGISAEDAYTLKNVPIIPPAMRPASVLPDGTVKWADLNGLYKDLGALNSQMAKPDFQTYLSDEDKKEHRKGLYDGLKALMGVGMTYADRENKNKGLLLQISGKSPKAGYFQKTLLSRRQDLTMRSTIVPEPDMGIDEVGLPTEKALTLFRPFMVKKMVDIGVANHALEAQEILGKKGAAKDKQVLKALDMVMEERPVLMKRDPALHKHSVQGFNARRVPGKAIQIHPLVTSGYNADFDGDAMSVYVPITNDAVAEARKMMPSNNLFNEATGSVTHVPTLESALGLYKMSLMKGDGKKRMNDQTSVLKAVQSGKLGMTDTVTVKGVGKTTAGRIMLADAVPEAMRKKVLTDPDMVLDKKGLPALYTTIAKEHRGDYASAADKLKDLGFGMTYGAVKVKHPQHIGPNAVAAAEDPKRHIQFLPVPTHSLSLEDMTPDKGIRDKIVAQTQRRVDMINSSGISQASKDQRSIDEWMKATTQMVAEHTAKAKVNPDNLFMMLAAGVKPKPDQYQQLKLAPMLLEDASGKIVPTPVTKSYAEGLDLAGYWTQMHGARKGSVKKVQEVREPGYFSKQLINTSMNLQVNGRDCETTRGVALPVTAKDVYDRELAADITLKGKTFTKGTMLTPDIVAQMRSADKNAQVTVRSALKCEHGDGLCQKCAGLSPDGKAYEMGTNLGLLSAQSLGERSVQLSLKAFHSGGVVSGGGKTLGMFDRIKQLTEMPKTIPDSASLAMKSGTIEKVEHDKTGDFVTIGGQKHFVPLDRAGRRLTSLVPGTEKMGGFKWAAPKVGQKVQAGALLSDPNRTYVNPHELYKATKKMEHVQNHITNELHGMYAPEGVRRQHIETVVKAMSNLTRVADPGDAPGVLKGEFRPTSVMSALNKQLVKSGKAPVQHTPVLKGIDVMPIEVQEDWMAKMNFNRLRQTVIEAAATGGYSNLHGANPIPGAVYGAEFGMTEKDQHKKPHLKGVPWYGY